MKEMHKKKWLHVGIWLVLSVMLLLCIQPIEGNAASNNCTIKSCTISGSKSSVIVKAKISHKNKAMGKKLYLMELEQNEKVTKYLKRSPVAETKAKNGTVTFSTALTNGTSHTKLFSKFVVAYKSGKKYRVISDAPRYITNPEKLATFTENYPATYSKKGLQAENMEDSIELGTQHTVLNWVLNDFIMPDGVGDKYTFQGKDYYFDGGRLNNCDAEVHRYNESGSKVTVILLLYNINDPKINKMRFQGGGARYSSIRTSDKTSSRQFEALMSYLGQRYGQKSHVVSGWILGNEIDNTRDWNYAGGKSLSSYMDSYSQAFRICNTAVKSANKNAHVYVSLDYFWGRDLDDGGREYFSDKDILNTFYQKLKAQGLVDWYIAYHAYPQGLLLPEFWDDVMASNSADAEIVNFKNMDVLTKYVKNNFGKNVKIMFSEQSFTSSHGELMQAAAYAYAYYKCEANSMVEAFIYGRHKDNVGEVDPRNGGAIPWGLRDQNFNKRAIWDVFQYIDSPDGLHCTNPLLSKIGVIHSWNSISKFDKNRFAKMPSKRSKVSGLTIATTSYKSVNLTWNRDSYASGYEIYRATSKNGTYQKIASTSNNYTISYTDKKVSMGQTYYYKVRTWHAFAMADPIYGKYASKSVTVAVGPTEIISAIAGGESVNLTWTKVAQASGYYVYRSTAENGSYTYVATAMGGNTVTYTDTNLQPGNTYYYKVLAFVQTSTRTLASSESSPKSAVPLPQKMMLTTMIPGQNTMTLQWNPLPNVSGYRIYACNTKDGSYIKIKTVTDPSIVSHKVYLDKFKDSLSGPEYYFKVRAYTTVGSTKLFGEYSNVMYASTYANTPAITTLTRDADQNAIVTWNKIPEADAYQVWRCSTADGTYEQVGGDILQTDSLTYSYKDTTANPTDTWFYKIRIVEKVGMHGDKLELEKISLYGEWSGFAELSGTAVPPTGAESTGTESTGTESTGTEPTGTESVGTEATETNIPGTETVVPPTGAEQSTQDKPKTEPMTETEQSTENMPSGGTEKVNSAT